MTTSEEETTEISETSTIGTSDFGFTQEEVDFLLDRLKILKDSNSLDDTKKS